MKVVSQLANLDFQVGDIRREGNRLVVTSAEGKGIPTTVYIRPSDTLQVVKAVFRSASALGYVLLFPLYWYRDRHVKVEEKGNINNPWN